MDKGAAAVSFGAMSAPASTDQKLVTPVSLVVDLILLVVFSVFMYKWLAPHVPSNDPAMIRLWGALTTSCMTGVFWLALQMFRVTFAFQRASRKK